MSRVLITGAGGFVGSHLALGLAKLGYTPLLNDQTFDDNAAVRLQGIERFSGDVRDLQMQLGASGIDTLEYLIHGAAVTASPSALGIEATAYLAESMQVTLAALELAQHYRVKRFVLISSAGVFSSSSAFPLDETAQPDGLGYYAAAKRMGELATLSLRTSGSLDAVGVRLGNLYGSDERSRVTRPRLSLVARLLGDAKHKTMTLTTPAARREWTCVDDLAFAFAQLLEHAAPPDLTHFCAPEVVSDSELATKLQQLLPGANLVARPETGTPNVRPPLESRFTETLGLAHWTPLDIGLAALISERVSI